jgi:Tol biopolymer transport system component/DNA-binding winged helix-turn-helix (wHTH) protein
MIGVKSLVFRFADIEVREREFSIIKEGQVVPVEPKAFRVLLFLLHNPLKLITKDELLDAVWGETAVSENSLARSVALLRRLLGDDTHQPRYIETVATVGYRFVCPVEELGNASELACAEPTDKPTEPQASKHRSRKVLWNTLAASGVVLLGLAGLMWYLSRPLPALHVISYRQITTDGQWKGIAGTDGNSLYINLTVPVILGVVPVSGGRVTPLSIDLPSSRNQRPWIIGTSPDGTRLLILSDVDPSSWGGSLWIVDAHGGGARLLAKGVSSNATSATWSPDGATVLYCTPHGDLYTIPSQGGDSRLLLASTAPAGTPNIVYGLAWSPDGSRMRFARNDRYWEVSADGKNAHEVLPNWRATNPKYFMCCGKWTPDGDFFLFLAGSTTGFPQDPAAREQMWALDERRSWLHRSSPEPVQLTTGVTACCGFIPSKDGKTIFSLNSILRGELVRYDTESRQLAPYLGGISAEFVNFSKDGKSLVYVTFPEGIMWRANRDGSGLQQLTNPPMHPANPRWSPDGSQIVFFDMAPSGAHVMYTIPSQGGTPRRLLPGDEEMDLDPSWSPDGKKIVFRQTPAGLPTGGPGIGTTFRVLELDTGKATDLPPCPKPCFAPRWSPDSRYILGVPITQDDVALFSFRTNRWSLLNLRLAGIKYPAWSHDGHFIYFEICEKCAVKSIGAGVYRIPATGGKLEKVADLKGFRDIGFLGDYWSLDPDDNPLLLRNTGTYDIYALALERK